MNKFFQGRGQDTPCSYVWVRNNCRSPHLCDQPPAHTFFNGKHLALHRRVKVYCIWGFLSMRISVAVRTESLSVIQMGWVNLTSLVDIWFIKWYICSTLRLVPKLLLGNGIVIKVGQASSPGIIMTSGDACSTSCFCFESENELFEKMKQEFLTQEHSQVGALERENDLAFKDSFYHIENYG